MYCITLGCFTNREWCLNIHVIFVIYFCNSLTKGSFTALPSDYSTPVLNFFCVTYNWERDVECTWDYNTHQYIKNINIKWQLVYHSTSNFNTRNSVWHACPLPGHKLKSCKWKLYDDIDPNKEFYLCITLPQQNDSCYDVNIQALVKPDPVSKLRANVKNSTSVSLEWNHSRYHNTSFQLIIRTEGRELFRKIFVVFQYINFEEQTCTEKSGYYVSCDKDAMIIILTDLSKYTLYLFSVSSKPTIGGFWSNENTVQVKTSKDIPSAPPTILEGAYSIQQSSGNKRIITVYWLPLPKKEWNDEKVRYKIQFIINGTIIQKECTQDFSATIHHISLEIQIIVHVWAENTIGMSKDQSEIAIYNKDSYFDDELVAMKMEQHQIELFWKNNDDIDIKHYNLFWCEQVFGNLCKQTPSSTQINSSFSNSTIPGMFIESLSYLFGLSYTTVDNRTVGFNWSNCYIDLSTSEFPLISLDVILNPQEKGILVKWWLKKCNLPVVKKLIRFYVIHVCNERDCKDYTEKKIQGTENTFLVASSKETVCVRVFPEWKGGIVKTSSPVCVDGMEYNKGKLVQVIIGVGAVVVILAIVGGCMITRKLWKVFKKAYEPCDITVPPIITRSNNDPIHQRELECPLV